MSKKSAIFGGALAVAGMGVATFFALAQTSLPPPSVATNRELPPLTVNIHQNNKVAVRGASVTAISGNTLTASTTWGAWGITWTVQTSTSTDFLRRHGGHGSLADFAVGHIISFEGTLVTSAAQPAVAARVLRDWSVQKININSFGTIVSISSTTKSFLLKTQERGNMTVLVSDATKITKQHATSTFVTLKAGDLVTVGGIWDRVANTLQAEHIKIHVETRRIFEGGVLKSLPVSTTPPTYIVATLRKIDYTVNIAVDTTILNDKWARVSLADFKVGDHIRVYGVADGTTIEATVVRNTSIKK